MVKRSADVELDSRRSAGKVAAVDKVEVDVIALPTPPELQTPAELPDSDTEMQPADYVLLFQSTPIWVYPDDNDDDDDDLVADAAVADGKARQVPTSCASTAAPTPAETSPCTSPASNPVPTDDDELMFTAEDYSAYSALTRDELREELGIAGTDMLEDWTREDLLATLMEIEKVAWKPDWKPDVPL
mmetsp:Transcript_47913/g.89724  ORF Transcript_47913/g.89724 Transcript_47913/m.89724 type:complete len:187 (-) Transcript_47913:59-619(-)